MSFAVETPVEPYYGLDRLQFQLPEFTRVSWATDIARGTWAPRIQAVSAAWQEIEWRAVLAGIRRCSATMVSADKLTEVCQQAARHGLASLPVHIAGAPDGYSNQGVALKWGEPFTYRVVVGSLDDVTAFQQAWDDADQQRIGELLGYPTCCSEFFHQVWVEQGLRDTTWPMAYRTSETTDDGKTIEVSGPPESNILWRWVGVRAASHLPCRFDCEATVTLGGELIDLGRELGHRTQMDWLLEILDWPVEWSALHGIAEIKTPILKVSACTDATTSQYIVRRPGSGYPAEGSRGLKFPYQSFARPKLTGSMAFKAGLSNPIPIVVENAEAPASATHIPRKAHGVKQRDLEGDLLLYKSNNQPGSTLNESAGAVWSLCDGRRDLWEICRELGKQFQVHGSLFVNDVRKVIDDLTEQGLLDRETALTEDDVQIDWSRIAASQPDNYDAVTLRAMAERRGEVSADREAEEPTLAGTTIGLSYCYPKTGEGLDNAPLDHPNLGKAIEYIRTAWPEVLAPLQTLIRSVHPVLDPEKPDDERAFLSGAHSHSDESQLGTLWVSVNCPLLLADCLVHEMAHNKLFAAGVFKESCLRLVDNLPEEPYKSPVITDRMRPMTALLHGVYAFTYVTELNVRVLPTLKAEAQQRKLRQRLRRNLTLLKTGLEELKPNIRVDAPGDAFLKGWYPWLDDLMERGERLL